MCAINFTIAFAIAIKFAGGNKHIREIIVITSESTGHLTCELETKRKYLCIVAAGKNTLEDA